MIVCHKSEALFISIQNIGGSPITAAQFFFDVESSEGTPFTFEIVSSRGRIDATNIYLQFDEVHPIGVGETYNTPLIPELTGPNIRLTYVQINGFGIAMVENLPGVFSISIIPDVTTHQFFNSNTNFGAIFSFHSGGIPISIDVAIDIKPGSDPNCFNNNTRGVIPIAILSSADFNAIQVDPSTVQLAGLAVKIAGKSNKYLAHTEDVNGDGLIDLVVQIEDTDQVFTTGTTTATLTGKLYDGTPIEGEDDICIVP